MAERSTIIETIPSFSLDDTELLNSPKTYLCLMRASRRLSRISSLKERLRDTPSCDTCTNNKGRCKLRGLLVRGLEPRLRKSGTRKFLGGSDHSPKIIK